MQRLRTYISVTFYRNIPQALEFLPRRSKHVLNNFSGARLSDLPKKGKCLIWMSFMSSKSNGHFTAKKLTILLEHGVI